MHPPAIAPKGPLGTVRPLLKLWLLSAITLGIYGLYALYKSYDEMNRYNGLGANGSSGLLVALFAGLVNMWYFPSQIGVLYASEGERSPVSVLTGFWFYLPFIGWIVWFVKVYGSLNRFWQARGAV